MSAIHRLLCGAEPVWSGKRGRGMESVGKVWKEFRLLISGLPHFHTFHTSFLAYTCGRVCMRAR